MKKIIVYAGDFRYSIDCAKFIFDSNDNTLVFFDGICFLGKINNKYLVNRYEFERLHIEKFSRLIVENINDE